MSGDVQPRKRKDKRKKKGEEEILHHHGSIGGSDEIIHIHKDSNLGGNICAKIVFFGLLAALGGMIGLIILEYHGTNDVSTQSSSNSPWSVMLEGWVDDSVSQDHHDDDHESHKEDNHDEHDNEARDYDEDDTIDNNSEEDQEDSNEVEEKNEDGEYDDDEIYDEESEEEEEDDDDEGEEDEVEEEIEDEVEEEDFDEMEEEEEEDGEEEEDCEEDHEIEENDDDDEEDQNGSEEGMEEDEEVEDEDEAVEYEDEKGINREHKKNEADYDDEGDEEMSDSNNNRFGVHYKGNAIINRPESWKYKKKDSKDIISNSKIKYIHKIMEKLRKEDKSVGVRKTDMSYPKKVVKEEKDEDILNIDQDEMEKEETIISQNEPDHDSGEEEPLADEKVLNEGEDETSGVALKFGVGVALVFVAHIVLIRKWNEGDKADLLEAVETVPESAEVPPTFIERRQTLIPAEIMEDTTAIFPSQESDYSDGEHEDEGGDEIDTSFVKETYEALRASYNQITPEESEAEIIEEDASLKSNEYAASESEPEASESDEEVDEPQQINDPLGQWKIESGPELLAEEVKVIQSESETGESEDEISSAIPTFDGPKSVESEDDDVYEKSHITNEADWEIKDELDDADKELDDADFPVNF